MLNLLADIKKNSDEDILLQTTFFNVLYVVVYDMHNRNIVDSSASNYHLAVQIFNLKAS